MRSQGLMVGVPKEIKDNENRVALTPAGVGVLRQGGCRVLVERGAGVGSGYGDEIYVGAGAEMAAEAGEVWAQAGMIMKVKEPQAVEYERLQGGQILFTFLHLAAADRKLTEVLLAKKVTAIAYETVQTAEGKLPLLIPMSEVAGRVAVQVGATFLQKTHGGRGILLGGVPGVEPGVVVILGGGAVGTNAAQMAMGLGAQVMVIDRDAERLRQLDEVYGGRLMTLMSSPETIGQAVRGADLLIGAVLVCGAKAPHLVSEAMVKTMKAGSVIVDVAIDQGGSIETIDRVTTHSNPTYVKHGVVHYAVANMPGIVPRTSTLALTNVTLPYAVKLAGGELKGVLRGDAALGRGVNTLEGHCTHARVAEALGVEYRAVGEMLR